MTSRRELIVRDIVATLTNQQQVRLGTVSRDPGLDIVELANTAFPAVIISSGAEQRESITQGGPVQQRQYTMSVAVQVWINSNAAADTQLNNLIESIEELLEVDPTRGAVAFDTQLTEVDVAQDVSPYNSMNLVFTITGVYTKGNP